jgi:hypothetical protein
MRRSFKLAVMMVVMLVGAQWAPAQLIDPSTGVMVDEASDPMDFSAIASGQPGNIGMELSAQASEQMQTTMAANAASSSAMDSLNAANADDATPAVAVPAVPATPKPVIAPGGRRSKEVFK